MAVPTVALTPIDFAATDEIVTYILSGGIQLLADFFVEKELIESEFTCFICLNLLEQPTYLPTCLHTFCRSCLVTWEANQKPIDSVELSGRRRVPRATCPICRSKFLIELCDKRRADPSCLVRPNPVIRRATYALVLDCPLGHCAWRGPLKDLAVHVVNECAWFTQGAACRHAGCTAKLFRYAVAAHEAACPFAPSAVATTAAAAADMVPSAPPATKVWGVGTMRRIAAGDDAEPEILRELRAAAVTKTPPPPKHPRPKRDERPPAPTPTPTPPPPLPSVTPPTPPAPAAAEPSPLPVRHVTLSRLRVAVDECGGFFAVEQAAAWPQVAKRLELPNNAAPQLRDAYRKKLPSSVRRVLSDSSGSASSSPIVPHNARGNSSNSGADDADTSSASASPAHSPLDASGRTPLCAAAYDGDVKSVARLLSSKFNSCVVVDRDWPDALGYAPLLLASKRHHLNVVALLLAAGAHANCVAPDTGESALHFLCALVPDLAQRAAYRRVIAELVAGQASVLAASSSGSTPLHVAARAGNAVAAYVLLTSSSVDIDAVAAKTSGFVPPPSTTRTKQTQIDLLALLVNEARSADAISAVGPAWTALHMAVASGDADLVELLLINGVTHDASAQDEHGNWVTPLDVAVAAGHDDIATLLRNHQASGGAAGGARKKLQRTARFVKQKS